MNLCSTEPDSICLLPHGAQDDRTCAVCMSLIRWKGMSFTHILVREADAGGAFIFPAVLQQLRPVDLQGCILQVSLTNDLVDIRRTVNTAVVASDRTWLWQEQEGEFVELAVGERAR